MGDVRVTVTALTGAIETFSAPEDGYSVTAHDNGQLQIQVYQARTITYAAGAWQSVDVEVI